MRTNKEIARQWRGQAGPPSCLIYVFSAPVIFVGAGALAVVLGVVPVALNPGTPKSLVAAFGLAFLAGGVAVLSIGLWQARNRRAKATVYQADYAWSPLGISDDTVNTVWQSAWKALALGSFLAPFHIIMFFLIRPVGSIAGIVAWAILGLFDLCLAGLIWQSFYWARQRLRFGKTWVRFSRFPFHPGETLAVTFEGGPKLESLNLSVGLRCIEEKLSDGIDNPGLRCYEVYLDQRACATDYSGRASITFSLPGDVPGTQLSQKTPTYWELVIEAEAPGGCYAGTFLMPIYAKAS